jgi:hypothetical protein
MRKPRDIDAELKALQERQKSLKARKVTQLGELVLATGADTLDPELLAGVLLDAVARAASDDDAQKTWRSRGEGFFRRERRSRAASGTGDVAPPPAAPNRDGAGAFPEAAAPG